MYSRRLQPAPLTLQMVESETGGIFVSPLTAIDKFYSKVPHRPAIGCWEWGAGLFKQGYGGFWDAGKQHRAHRWIWIYLNGPIPAGKELDHLCRNRKCIRVSHLEPVTSQENTLRGNSPCAVHARQTHCLRGHLLGPSISKRRRCIQCSRIYDAARRLRGR